MRSQHGAYHEQKGRPCDRTPRCRAGFTVVEVLVGLSIFVLVLSILFSLTREAQVGTNLSVDASDALRSVFLATETMRRDVSRLVFQTRDDLSIFNQGRGLSFLVADTLGDDLWNSPATAVTYMIRPASSQSDVFQLVCQDKSGTRTVAGCYLKDLMVVFRPKGQISPLQAYLEISMIGVGSPGGKATYAGSSLIPLTPLVPPRFYLLPEEAS